jgi:hypothetical protein
VLYFADEDNLQGQVFEIGISPKKKAEKKAFLGRDEVRCTIIVDKKMFTKNREF